MTMTQLIMPATLRRSAAEKPWEPLTTQIVVGKDILDLLSSSMYIDPMAIYREYVQNAADAIDSMSCCSNPAKGSWAGHARTLLLTLLIQRQRGARQRRARAYAG